MAPAKGTTKAPTMRDFRGSIAWLSGSLPTYHDVGYPSPRKARFQVLVRLSWAGFYPQGSCKRFPTHFMFVFLLFQASWHNPLFPLAAYSLSCLLIQAEDQAAVYGFQGG